MIVFTKVTDAENLIQTAHHITNSSGYFKWIGTEGWTEQLPNQRKDYLKTLNGNLKYKF